MDDLKDFAPDGRKTNLLREMLSMAVPLHVHEIADWPWELKTAEAGRCAQIVAEKGDCLMFQTKGETAKAFNALTRGLACLAFVPGGVKFLGERWDASALLARGVPKTLDNRLAKELAEARRAFDRLDGDSEFDAYFDP